MSNLDEWEAFALTRWLFIENEKCLKTTVWPIWRCWIGSKSNLIISNNLKYSFFVGETTTAHQALSSFWGKKGGNIAYGVGKKSRLSNYQCTVNHLSNMCELFVSLFEAAFNNWAAQQGTAKVIGAKYHKHLPYSRVLTRVTKGASLLQRWCKLMLRCVNCLLVRRLLDEWITPRKMRFNVSADSS